MGDTDALHFEDDDVPADFFDAFSNQDFMAGLDVVDVWDDDDDEVLNTGKLENDLNTTNQKKKKEHSRRAHRRRRSREKAIKLSRSRSGGTHKRGKNEEGDKMMRDPEKSKRDIQKDKDKCTKNNEARIITEKLKVVETGLIPPGCELEYNLQAKDIQAAIGVTDLREKLRKKSRSSSFDLSARLLQQRKRSLERRRTMRRQRTRSPIRRVSPNASSHSWRRSISPQSRSNSPLSHRSSIDHERHGKYQTRSPHRRRYSRTRSPRESWLRDRGYRHKRSSTPSNTNDKRRHAPKDFLEELADKLKYNEKKKKILQEISHKLNGPARLNHTFPHRPMGGPTGQPAVPGHIVLPPVVPPPNFCQPPPPMSDPAPQYDQSFFIGQPNSFRDPNSYPNAFPPYAQDHFESKSAIVPQPVKPPNIYCKKSIPLTDYQKEEDQKAATKLLEDKTLSLSDFLSMSVKYNADSSKPVNLHKKVKVLAQCQDAIKSLASSSQLIGQFFGPKISNDIEKPAMKCLSPLRKIPVTRFVITTPWKGAEEKGTLYSPIQKLLVSLNFSSNLSTTKPKRSMTPLSTDSDIEYIPPLSALEPPQLTIQPKTTSSQVMNRFQNKLVQTDITKCEQCETRQAIRYTQQGSQCNTTTVECGTQITEEDMNRFGIKLLTTGGPKKSLAHLTAAQLLGKDEPTVHKTMQMSSLLTSEIHTDFPLRRGIQTSNSVPKIPRLINQLQSSMRVFERNVGGRQKLDNTNEMSNRRNVHDYNVRTSGFNHTPEFEEYTLPFDRQQEEKFQQRHLDDEQMQLQQPFFEPPEYRDNYYNQGFNVRKYF